MFKKFAQGFFFLLMLTSFANEVYSQASNKRPNILFCIADDASFQHMSAYGLTDWVSTPAFDRLAKEGLLFTRAYTPNAKCSPSRASILTGRNPWQLEEAANHSPYFPAKFTTFMEALKQNGYETGFTGKGWGPGSAGQVNGKDRMLTGPAFNKLKVESPLPAMSNNHYAANFARFLEEKPDGKPFSFWFGAHEPHRPYRYGSGLARGKKKLSDIDIVPSYWIDNEATRNDMLDYALEVEHFDQSLAEVLEVLEKSGELENTIIVVTSDNGMPFPRTKGHVYEYDNHLPLAIMWKGHIQNPGRKIDEFVSFIDFAPTFLELAGITTSDAGMQPIQGKSLVPFFKAVSNTSSARDHVLLGRERQDVGRPDDQGYPVRAIVKGNYIYSINYEPERWPASNPETGYRDTDSGPTKTSILEANRSKENTRPWELSFGKKPAEELYQIDKDPFSVNNLASDKNFSAVKRELKAQLEKELKEQSDPRILGMGYIFDNYPYANPEAKDYYNRVMKGEKLKGLNDDVDLIKNK